MASRRIELSDPAGRTGPPAVSRGGGYGEETRAAARHARRVCRKVRRQSVDAFLREQEKAGRRFDGVGIVVGSLIDPAQIANDHIRIHALEGQLFRGIVKAATDRRKLAASVWRERDLHGFAEKQLKRSEVELRRTVAELGASTGGPWRAEHKAASVAAWLALGK